jgi:putative two-component system response regulator
LRVWNLLETRYLHLQLHDQNRSLEEQIRQRTQQLQGAELETLERLAKAAEWRDDETGQHTYRVGQTSALLAQALHLPSPQVAGIRYAAPLHDVVKIGIPDSILLKPGKLTDAELAVMRDHPVIGSLLLSKSHSELLQMAEHIALTHHERWNGLGYPNGLRAEAVPVEGRIVAVADVFDALTHERPYKHAWPVDRAVDEISAQREKQFDPAVVDAFLALDHSALI